MNSSDGLNEDWDMKLKPMIQLPHSPKPGISVKKEDTALLKKNTLNH